MSTPNSSFLSRFQESFQRNFSERGDLGASVVVYQHGEPLIELADGFTSREQNSAWTLDTLVPVWSATKGPAAITCLLALHEAGIKLDHPVVSLWPAFGQNGKSSFTFAELLSHQAGVSALDEKANVEDFEAVIHALETQAPYPSPDSPRQGYHARTFGFILDQLVRLATRGTTLGDFFRQRFGDPLALDFWIGLPESEFSRVATLYPGKMRLGVKMDDFMKAYLGKETLTHRTFNSPLGLHAATDLNRPEIWAQSLASMGGIGSARALAKFYAMVAHGGWMNQQRFLPEEILSQLSTRLTQKFDDVLCTPISFGPGVMLDPLDAEGHKLRFLYGKSLKAFGHPGAGGSLAFADPERDLSFAYVMNQMEPGALPNERALDLVALLNELD